VVKEVGASLIAQVVVAKTVDHLPLYRQEKIFERHGVEISRKTMRRWRKWCCPGTAMHAPESGRRRRSSASVQVVEWGWAILPAGWRSSRRRLRLRPQRARSARRSSRAARSAARADRRQRLDWTTHRVQAARC